MSQSSVMSLFSGAVNHIDSARFALTWGDPRVVYLADLLAWMHDDEGNLPESYPGPGWDCDVNQDSNPEPTQHMPRHHR